MWGVGQPQPAVAGAMQPATIEDAIGMVRIQGSVSADGSVGSFSPDGERFATVTWRGDLTRNINVYSLLVMSLGVKGAEVPPVDTVLTRDFAGTPDDVSASPISQITFLDDNKTIAFLGRDGAEPAQVYAVDTATRNVRQLTHHPSAVRSFAVASDGTLRAFSAVLDVGDESRKIALDSDGVFLWDKRLFTARNPFVQAWPVVESSPRQIRQYFTVVREMPRPFFDSLQSRAATPLDLSSPEVVSAPAKGLDEEAAIHHWASFTGDSRGRWALLFPYGLTDHPMRPERYAFYQDQNQNAYTRRVAAPYGLVNLATGAIERFIDAPHPQFDSRSGGGPPVWSPDGKSVLIYSLLPIQGDAAARAHAAEARPQWLEVLLKSRKIIPLELPKGWRVLSWEPGGKALVIQNGNHFGLLPHSAHGEWGALQETARVSGLSADSAVASNGRWVIGITEAPLQAPELTALDLNSKSTTTLTDFNPQLRGRQYGSVEEFHWRDNRDRDGSGFLVTPINYTPRTRYPLIILLDDGTLSEDVAPYLLDSHLQLSGNAIQTLAAQGFIVLYTREPRDLPGLKGTPEEGPRVRAHVESAIGKLDREALIDISRIGLSGWSRAGYQTDYLLMNSSVAFAAASQIDGGALEYDEGNRPFTDEELDRIRTPLLLEPHGLAMLIEMSPMADRLNALGRPTEILYFAAAPHSTVRPQHRFRSLGTHMDWWRFWLQDYEDPDPAKAAQYAKWRQLRKQRDRLAFQERPH